MDSNDTPKIVITGGGTGGHIFPALAIADELSERGYKIIYVGGPNGMESKIVPPRGYEFHGVQSIQVKNKNLFRVIGGLFTLIKSVFWSVSFLKKIKPKAVIGVGGYVSVPVAVGSFLTRIPLFLQEQNASVGIANRFLGKLSTKIFLGFEKAKSSFPESRCIITGNPIRKEFSASAFNRPDPKQPCLFIFGGSQGAKAINTAVMENMPKTMASFPHIKIIHQTGEPDFERVNSFYKEEKISARVLPFIEDMVACYQEASIVICRSGALTISELMAVQRPAILVPYPRRGQNDQTANAYMLQDAGVARVVEQGPDFEKRFWRALEACTKPEAYEMMIESFSRLRVPDALATIGDHLAKEIDGKVSGAMNV